MEGEVNRIKDIWTKFIDVQDQLLKLRQESIPILTESITVSKKQIKAVVDETSKIDRVISAIRKVFKLDESNIDYKNGIITKSFYTPSDTELYELVHFATSNYIRFSSKPELCIKVKNRTQSVELVNQYYIHSSENCNLRSVIFEFDIKSNIPQLDKAKNNQIFDGYKVIGRKYQLTVFPIKRKSTSLFEDNLCDWSFLYTLHKQKFDRIFGCDSYDFAAIFTYDVSTIESDFIKCFPSIRVSRDSKNDILRFYQEYTQNTKSKLFRMLSDYVRNFNKEDMTIEFPDTLPKEDCFYFDVEEDAQREHIETRIRELRGSTLSVGGKELGTLMQVNYPNIIVDISESEIENIDQLIDAGALSHLTPNLTGDIEKMHRLKDSLSRIIKGERVNNKHLSEFIFDASKAKCIQNDDLEVSLHHSGEYYRDIESHLLNRRVNSSQIEAVIKTLLAEDLALIQGPPGTGKSTAIAEIIWQHIRKNQDERILLTSETNLAVDNAIDRVKSRSNNLVKPIRFGDGEKLENEGRQFSLGAMKQWVESASEGLDGSIILDDWTKNIASRVSILSEDVKSKWSNILLEPKKQHREWFYEQYVKNCNVIGATCSSIGDLNSRNRQTGFFRNYCEVFGKTNIYTDKEGIKRKNFTSNDGIKFTTVIQDESSKATPAELSLPLIYGEKSIVIGDHRQLPPMLDREEFISSMEYLLSKVNSPKEQKSIENLLKYVKSNFKELEISHFERLFNNIDSSLKGLFNLQYRMHPDINEVIKQFYVEDGGLQCGLNNPIDLGVNDPDMSNPASRFHGIEIGGLLSKENHVLWIDTNSPEMREGTSRVNYGEVDAIKWVLSQMGNSESYMNYQDFWNNEEDKQIGVISFYGKQLKLLNELKNEFSHIPMRISTVDRFQGMERNIVIVSMVRSTTIANNNNQRPDYELYGDLGYQEQKDLGFAKSPNRLNVALSRAKRLLIIVGNSTLYRQNSIYDNVYNAIKNNPNGKIIKYPHNDR